MPDFEDLAKDADKVVQEHGGVKGVTHDAEQLKDVAGGSESTAEKAKDAEAILKQTNS
jgi:hypothetical protein